jgi:hypothetical protein
MTKSTMQRFCYFCIISWASVYSSSFTTCIQKHLRWQCHYRISWLHLHNSNVPEKYILPAIFTNLIIHPPMIYKYHSLNLRATTCKSCPVHMTLLKVHIRMSSLTWKGILWLLFALGYWQSVTLFLKNTSIYIRTF